LDSEDLCKCSVKLTVRPQLGARMAQLIESTSCLAIVTRAIVPVAVVAALAPWSAQANCQTATRLLSSASHLLPVDCTIIQHGDQCRCICLVGFALMVTSKDALFKDPLLCLSLLRYAVPRRFRLLNTPSPRAGAGTRRLDSCGALRVVFTDH
jgi:hypothetical protein